MKGTPQQNGLAGRMNRTILERVRCILNTTGLSRKFWAEVVKIACYLINLCPSTALNFKTLHEVWTGSAANYKGLKVFGCSAYAHIRLDKLQPRANKCIFLGYPEGIKGYRLWCIEPSEEKCIISHDVVFNELDLPFTRLHTSQQAEGNLGNDNIQIEVEQKVDNSQ